MALQTAATFYNSPHWRLRIVRFLNVSLINLFSLNKRMRLVNLIM
jgi:hypothetical protein